MAIFETIMIVFFCAMFIITAVCLVALLVGFTIASVKEWIKDGK